MRIGLDLIRFALPPLVNRMKSARTKGPRSTFAMLPVTDIISCAVNLLTSPVAFRYNEYLEVSRALYTNQSLAGSRRVSSNCGTNAATQRDAQAPPTFGAPLAREHPVDRPTRCPSAGRHRRTSTSSAASAPESHPRINHGTRVAASAAPSRSRPSCAPASDMSKLGPQSLHPPQSHVGSHTANEIEIGNGRCPSKSHPKEAFASADEQEVVSLRALVSCAVGRSGGQVSPLVLAGGRPADRVSSASRPPSLSRETPAREMSKQRIILHPSIPLQTSSSRIASRLQAQPRVASSTNHGCSVGHLGCGSCATRDAAPRNRIDADASRSLGGCCSRVPTIGCGQVYPHTIASSFAPALNDRQQAHNLRAAQMEDLHITSTAVPRHPSSVASTPASATALLAQRALRATTRREKVASPRR